MWSWASQSLLPLPELTCKVLEQSLAYSESYRSAGLYVTQGHRIEILRLPHQLAALFARNEAVKENTGNVCPGFCHLLCDLEEVTQPLWPSHAPFKMAVTPAPGS